MTKANLSDNETRTLLGLVKYPTLNDRQLSERIGIKMSTVTAIKNRLKDLGFFITVRVPNLQNLGAEILSVTYAHTDPAVPEKTQMDVGRQLFEGFDELFYIGAGPRYRFSMSMHRNYSSACRVVDGVFDLYSRNGLLIPGVQQVVHFPFDQTKMYNFFDYSALLENAFDVQLPPRESDRLVHDGEVGSVTSVKLSRIERKVLKGLVQNPDLLDSNISKRIDVTRQSVTKMRKRFEDLDLFHALRIPNLELLGFEVLALVHTQYRPTSTIKDRAGPLKAIYDLLPIVFKAETDNQGVELVATRDYREFDEYMSLKVSHLRAEGVIDRDPRVFTFTFPSFQAVKNHVYSSGLTRIIEQE
jgi:DNA-binding MarR family transcriptional regulator